jgi:hypothetical protein
VPIPRRKTGLARLFNQTATYDFLIAIFASAVGWASALNYLSQGKPWLALAVAIGTASVLAVTSIKQGVAWAAQNKKESTHELDGCLHTLRAALDPGECRLRLAIHVPVEQAEVLEQVTEYIGDRPKPGRVGRRFPINAGIIGKAYRENDVLIGRRQNDDYDDYIRELVRDWNYTEARARSLNPATREWMAVPISTGAGADAQVEAVLYLDANCRQFFNDARQELVLKAATGIANFVGKRYA